MAGERYTNLCPAGAKTQNQVDREVAETKRTVYLLQQAEDEHPAQIPYYQKDLAQLRERLSRWRVELSQHVAHCADGCVRDSSGGLSQSAFQNSRSPAHAKPTLPSAEDLAARLRDGDTVDAIAAEYERHRQTITHRLSQAGYGTSGRPLRASSGDDTTPASLRLLEDEPWRDDALCAQTDPEAFFPEKGGSTREAKSVCATCTVAAECLDWALANNERFGIWGGLSERERRKLEHLNETGLIEQVPAGRVAGALVDAYEAAHETKDGRQ